jgi:hypothetical protein
MLFPPLEMVNTAGTLSVPPDSVNRPPRTVIWPPVGNVCMATGLISTAPLAATYETANLVHGPIGSAVEQVKLRWPGTTMLQPVEQDRDGCP